MEGVMRWKIPVKTQSQSPFCPYGAKKMQFSHWPESSPGNPTRLSQSGSLMLFLVQRTQLRIKLHVLAEPIQERGSTEKARSLSLPCSFPSQLLSFPPVFNWLYFLSDSLVSVFYLLTWQGEGIDFLL